MKEYRAENVDTKKALDEIVRCRQYAFEQEQTEFLSARKYREGVLRGLDMAEGIFKSPSYEKEAIPVSYEQCVADTIREIAKVLDLKAEDIMQSGKCMKGMCEAFAYRIMEAYERKDGTDNLRDVIESQGSN